MTAIVLPGRSRFALARREPNLLRGAKPTGDVKITQSPSSPVAMLFDRRGFIGAGSRIEGLVENTLYGRRAIDQSAISTNLSYQEWGRKIFSGPHTILFRSLWWGSTTSVEFSVRDDTPSFIRWWNSSIAVYRHLASWDDDVLKKTSPNSPYIDPSSGKWINTLHGSDGINYQSAQCLEGGSLAYGATTAISTPFETDGIFEITGGITSALDVLLVFNRWLAPAEAEWALKHWTRYLQSANDAQLVISVPAAGGTPTLSSPGAINVQSDRATPQVTLTF